MNLLIILKLYFREHDKNRGQYPKITEPKTPFNYDEVSLSFILAIKVFK